MVVSVRLSASILSLLAGLALASCGGDDPVVILDAQAIDATVDAQIDAFTCTAGTTMCSGECVNTSRDENYCGNCTTSCPATNVCLNGTCGCPVQPPQGSPPIIPANPQLLMSMTSDQFVPGATVGFGGIFGSPVNVLAVGYETGDVRLNHAYTLTAASLGVPPTPPFAGFGYDLDTNNPQALDVSLAYFATAGTLTFTKVCAGGMAGTLTNATFSMVQDLTNPTIVPGGCTFTVASVAFAIGTACP